MKLLKELAEGRLELPCWQIRLQRGGASPIDVTGPGLIELNDRGSFDYSLHVSAAHHHQLWFNQLQSIQSRGSIIRTEDLFTITADSYEHGSWSGRIATPSCGGTFGQQGMANGVVHELRSSCESANPKSNYAVFYLAGRIRFPALSASKVEHIRGDRLVSSSVSRDYSDFSVGEEQFRLFHEENHTEFECELAKGGISKNRHLRMQEAFYLRRPDFEVLREAQILPI